MSSEAISGLNPILNSLAASRGVSVDQLIARTQNARLSSGLNVAQLVRQNRETIQKSSIESLLGKEKGGRLKELEDRLSAQSGTTTSVRNFRSRLDNIESLARTNANAGPTGPFRGSRVQSSDEAFVTGKAEKGAPTTTFQVTVVQLATADQEAIFRIGDRTLRSASNTVGSDVTGLNGVTINLERVTQTTETIRKVNLTDLGAIEGFDKRDNTVRLTRSANEALNGADIVEAKFSRGLAGLASDQTFFLRRVSDNERRVSGREFEVFRSLQDATDGRNALDLVDVIGARIDESSDAIRDTRNALDRLRPGRDNLVEGFRDAQQGLDRIRRGLEGLRPNFDISTQDLDDALAKLQEADVGLVDATSAIRRREPANRALDTVGGIVSDFVRRLESGEEINRDRILQAVGRGLEGLQRAFDPNGPNAIPEAQAREVRNALNNVIEQFGELTEAGGEGDDDDDDDRGGRTRELTDRQFRQGLSQLGNRLQTLGNRFQSESNQADNAAITAVNRDLGDVREELGRITRQRGTGNQIVTTAVNVSLVARKTETITRDNPITVRVLRDPEEARKSIATLIENVTGAINLVEDNSALKGDLSLSRITTGLRRAFQQVVGAAGGAISTSGTSNAIDIDADALDQVLGDEGAFQRIESAVRGAAFGLIGISAGAGTVLENNIAGRIREQQQIESDIAGLKAEAEEKRAGLLAGLKDIATAALANIGAQASSRTFENRGRESNRISASVRKAQQNQNSLLQGLNGLTAATANVFTSRTTLQGFINRLG